MNVKFYFLIVIFLFLLSCQEKGQKHKHLTPEYQKDFSYRSSLLIDGIAKHYPRWNDGKRPTGFKGGVSDFGKYNYPKIIAQFYKYGPDSSVCDVAHKRMEIFKDKPTFHFNLVGLPRILYMFPEAESVKKYEKDFLDRVFERDDSYNPWTCEGTENHIGMSRTSGYLYAQLALEKYSERYPDAKEKLDWMKEWIEYTSERIYETGTGEWNSSIYGAYNIIGWLNLYDFAKDPDIKERAEAVLDYYASEMALHYTQAFIGGSDIRGKGNVKSFEGSAAFLGWLWFGDSPRPLNEKNIDNGMKNNEHIQSIHAAVSDYRPPMLAVKLANKELEVPAMYYNSKPDYLLEMPSYIKQTFYIADNYNIGAAYLPYGGWSAGNFQIVSWKFVSRVEPGEDKSVQYMSGVGMLSPNNKYFKYGNIRSPFDQIVHHKNVLIHLTKVPSDAEEIKEEVNVIIEQWRRDWEEDFYKRFPDDTDKKNPVHGIDYDVSTNRTSVVISKAGQIHETFVDSVLIIEFEKSYAAIRSIDGLRPTPLADAEGGGMMSTTVQREKGKLCGLVIEVANKDDFDSFVDFQNGIKEKSFLINERLEEDIITYQGINGDNIRVHYQDSGEFTEPIMDFGYGVEEPKVIQKSPPFKQPEWPKGKGHGKIAEWFVNDKLVDLNDYWPVFKGPNLYVGKGKLMLDNNKGTCYSVVFNDKSFCFTDDCSN